MERNYLHNCMDQKIQGMEKAIIIKMENMYGNAECQGTLSNPN